MLQNIPALTTSVVEISVKEKSTTVYYFENQHQNELYMEQSNNLNNVNIDLDVHSPHDSVTPNVSDSQDNTMTVWDKKLLSHQHPVSAMLLGSNIILNSCKISMYFQSCKTFQHARTSFPSQKCCAKNCSNNNTMTKLYTFPCIFRKEKGKTVINRSALER